jgi:hypothetical protein
MPMQALFSQPQPRRGLGSGRALAEVNRARQAYMMRPRSVPSACPLRLALPAWRLAPPPPPPLALAGAIAPSAERVGTRGTADLRQRRSVLADLQALEARRRVGGGARRGAGRCARLAADEPPGPTPTTLTAARRGSMSRPCIVAVIASAPPPASLRTSTKGTRAPSFSRAPSACRRALLGDFASFSAALTCDVCLARSAVRQCAACRVLFCAECAVRCLDHDSQRAHC